MINSRQLINQLRVGYLSSSPKTSDITFTYYHSWQSPMGTCSPRVIAADPIYGRLTFQRPCIGYYGVIPRVYYTDINREVIQGDGCYLPNSPETICKPTYSPLVNTPTYGQGCYLADVSYCLRQGYVHNGAQFKLGVSPFGEHWRGNQFMNIYF